MNKTKSKTFFVASIISFSILFSFQFLGGGKLEFLSNKVYAWTTSPTTSTTTTTKSTTTTTAAPAPAGTPTPTPMPTPVATPTPTPTPTPTQGYCCKASNPNDDQSCSATCVEVNALNDPECLGSQFADNNCIGQCDRFVCCCEDTNNCKLTHLCLTMSYTNRQTCREECEVGICCLNIELVASCVTKNREKCDQYNGTLYPDVATCQLPENCGGRCGDGIVQSFRGEQCDPPGSGGPGNGCNDPTPYCNDDCQCVPPT